MASGRFFEVLGVPAILGRTFTPDNDIRRGTGTERRQVAVISYSYWQRQYGGAGDVLGKIIELDRVAFTILGVSPPPLPRVAPCPGHGGPNSPAAGRRGRGRG